MKVAQARQKSQADNQRTKSEFGVGNNMFGNITTVKGVMRFAKKGRLSPKCISPFEIFERVGDAAFGLAFHILLSEVHGVFHVSILRKYIANSSHALSLEPH